MKTRPKATYVRELLFFLLLKLLRAPSAMVRLHASIRCSSGLWHSDSNVWETERWTTKWLRGSCAGSIKGVLKDVAGHMNAAAHTWLTEFCCVGSDPPLSHGPELHDVQHSEPLLLPVSFY